MKVTIRQAYTGYGSGSYSRFEPHYMGAYTVYSPRVKSDLQHVLLPDLEDTFQKEGLKEKILSFSEKLTFKDVAQEISRIRFYSVTKEYEMPFLREGVLDYYFLSNIDYIFNLYAKHRGRNYSLHLYEHLPLMPVGFVSRYWLQRKYNYVFRQENDLLDSYYLEDRHYYDQPIEAIRSLLDPEYQGTYDFILHPMFLSLDSDSQKRLIQKTCKAITIWSNFIKDHILIEKRGRLWNTISELYSMEFEASKDAIEIYEKHFSELITLKKRDHLYIRLCGFDRFAFFFHFKKIKNIYRDVLKYLPKSIDGPIYKGNNTKPYKRYSLFSLINMLVNYSYLLLYYMIYTLIEDDPAFQFIEGWFSKIRETRNEYDLTPFRYDMKKEAENIMFSWGMASIDKVHGKQTYPKYDWSHYVWFYADDSVWMDTFVPHENAAQQYDQFLYKTEVMSLEDAFDASTLYRIFGEAYELLEHYSKTPIQDLESRLLMISKLRSLLDKESEEAYNKNWTLVKSFVRE